MLFTNYRIVIRLNDPVRGPYKLIVGYFFKFQCEWNSNPKTWLYSLDSWYIERGESRLLIKTKIKLDKATLVTSYFAWWKFSEYKLNRYMIIWKPSKIFRKTNGRRSRSCYNIFRKLIFKISSLKRFYISWFVSCVCKEKKTIEYTFFSKLHATKRIPLIMWCD